MYFKPHRIVIPLLLLSSWVWAAQRTSAPSPYKTVAAKTSASRSRNVSRTPSAHPSTLRKLAVRLSERRAAREYRAMERYARAHAKSRSGAVAWFAVGYWRLIDEQYGASIKALKRARSHAGPLEDYVRYFLALAYSRQRGYTAAVELLEGFEKQMPHSIFRADAATLYGESLYELGRNEEAIAFLEAHRKPTRPEIELVLGKCYLRSDHPEKGMEILKHLYFTMPLSPEAPDAKSALTLAGSSLVSSYDDMRTRADLLADARQWRDARRAYRELLVKAPAKYRPGIQVALASVLRHGGSDKEVRALLEKADATGEDNARRLYLLGELARDRDDNNALDANLQRMRKQAPASPWLRRALRSAANYYLLRNELEHSGALFAEEQHRFPRSEGAAYANWKAAWYAYRVGHRDLAVQGFETQVAMYSDSAEVAGALYWRARIAEDDGDYKLARAWYAKLAQRYRNFYYGTLGSERLAKLPPAVEEVSFRASDPLLAKIPPVDAPARSQLRLAPPPGDPTAEKSSLLQEAALGDFAVRELKAVRGAGNAGWTTYAIASIYAENGEDHRALRYMKGAVAGYYSLRYSDLPRAFWELLFPLPYWKDLHHQAVANKLDPYLVAALIRQESEFNPGAVSRARAYGLMQLLARTGRKEASSVRMRHYSTRKLMQPRINIRLGTSYFRKMVTQYDGQVEYALAAYNAGTDRVDQWREWGTYRDMPEFVESIPFTETRGYVQAIMRNASVYRQLYSKH
jgi:soluble lytic murein transglycosylase